MTKAIKINSEVAKFFAGSEAAHQLWLQGGLQEALLEGKAWATPIDATNQMVLGTKEAGLSHEELQELGNGLAEMFSDGEISGVIFDCLMEEVGDKQEYHYVGDGPDGEPLDMHVMIPSGYRVMESVKRVRKDGTVEMITVDLTERPHLTAKQNGGKAIRDAYWYDKFKALARETAWGKMFAVTTADFIGAEGVRRLIQRVATMHRNIDKKPNLMMNTSEKSGEYLHTCDVTIQKKERQIQKFLVQCVRILMDKYIARKNWELFLDDTKSEKEKEALRNSLSVDRFDPESQPVAYEDIKAGDKGVYCPMYAKFYTWFFGAKGEEAKKKRSTQELLDIVAEIKKNIWKVQVHVMFTTAVFKGMQLELSRNYVGLECDDDSKDHENISLMAQQKASAELTKLQGFFTAFQAKRSTVKPLTRK